MLLKQLFRLAALLALLLAPAGMLGGHAAMAMPLHDATMSMSHCEQQQQQQDEHQAMIDCAMACSAMPSIDPFLPPPVRPVAPQFESSASLDIEGTRPEAATPPPRAL